MPITGYEALYSLLGPHYGGDGKTNFALPDLRGYVIVGAGMAPSLGNKDFPFAKKGGNLTADVVLNANQLPPHTHPATLADNLSVKVQASTNLTGNTYVPSATNKYLAASPANPSGAQMWSNTLTGAVDIGGVTGHMGAGAVIVGDNATQNAKISIPTQPPFVALNFIIAVQGLYPPFE